MVVFAQKFGKKLWTDLPEQLPVQSRVPPEAACLAPGTPPGGHLAPRRLPLGPPPPRGSQPGSPCPGPRAHPLRLVPAPAAAGRPAACAPVSGVREHRSGRRVQHQQAQQLPDVSTSLDAAVQVCCVGGRLVLLSAPKGPTPQTGPLGAWAGWASPPRCCSGQQPRGRPQSCRHRGPGGQRHPAGTCAVCQPRTLRSHTFLAAGTCGLRERLGSREPPVTQGRAQ